MESTDNFTNEYNQAVTYINHGQLDKAIQKLEWCHKINPNDLLVKFCIGFTLFHLDKYQDGLKLMIDSYDGDQSISHMMTRCVFYSKLEHIADYRNNFKKILDKFRYDYPSLLALSRLNLIKDHHPAPNIGNKLHLYAPGNGDRWWTPPFSNPIDIVCSSMMAGRMFDPEVAAAAARILAPGDLVLDGGANFGQMAVAFGRCVGPAGRVIAVEADPFVAQTLRLNAAENNVDAITVVQAALWDQDGETVYFPPWDQQTLPTMASRALDPALQTGDIPIATCTIDRLLAEQAADRPLALLKLDVQGAELHALQGAQQSLLRWSPAVIIELEDVSATPFGHQPQDLVAFLSEIGLTQREQLDHVNWLIRRPTNDHT